MLLHQKVSPVIWMKAMVFIRSSRLPYNHSFSIFPWGHYFILAFPKRGQNCRTCSGNCGIVWHGQSSTCASLIQHMCCGRQQCLKPLIFLCHLYCRTKHNLICVNEWFQRRRIPVLTPTLWRWFARPLAWRRWGRRSMSCWRHSPFPWGTTWCSTSCPHSPNHSLTAARPAPMTPLTTSWVLCLFSATSVLVFFFVFFVFLFVCSCVQDFESWEGVGPSEIVSVSLVILYIDILLFWFQEHQLF